MQDTKVARIKPDHNADNGLTKVINKGRGQTSNLIINIRGRGWAWSLLAVKHGEEGWRRRGGRVPTTHNVLIYQEGEGVVHGGRPAGYTGGGRPICFGAGPWQIYPSDETTHRPGRAVPIGGATKQRQIAREG